MWYAEADCSVTWVVLLTLSREFKEGIGEDDGLNSIECAMTDDEVGSIRVG